MQFHCYSSSNERLFNITEKDRIDYLSHTNFSINFAELGKMQSESDFDTGRQLMLSIENTVYSDLFSKVLKRDLESHKDSIDTITHPDRPKDLPLIEWALELSDKILAAQPVNIFTGVHAKGILLLSDKFIPENSPLRIGVSHIGEFARASVYMVPESVIPGNVIYVESANKLYKCTLNDL